MSEQKEIEAAPGRTAEFAAFYQSDFKPLIRSLVRVGASPAEAEDVAQEAMLATLRRWTAVRNPKAFVRTAAVRILRRGWDERKRDAVAEQQVSQQVWAACFDPNEDRALALELLRSLPRAQREAFAWSVDGYRPAEIAAFTGQTTATVRSNIRHARARMAARLGIKATRKETVDGPGS